MVKLNTLADGRKWIGGLGSATDSWQLALNQSTMGASVPYGVAADKHGYVYLSGGSGATEKITKIGTGRKGTSRGQIVKTIASREYNSIAGSGSRDPFYDWEFDEIIVALNYGVQSFAPTFSRDLVYTGELNFPSGLQIHSLFKDRVIPNRYYATEGTGPSLGKLLILSRNNKQLILERRLTVSKWANSEYGGDAFNGIIYLGNWSSGMCVFNYDHNANTFTLLETMKGAVVSSMGMSFADDDAGGMKVYMGNHSTTLKEISIPNMTLFNTNIAPTQPTLFTKQPPLNSTNLTSETIDLEWGSSTDEDGDTITYTLEFFNGSSWIVLASQLTSLTYTHTFPSLNTTNAQYRVKAVDSKGGESEYRTSNVFTIRKQLILFQDGGTIKTYKNGNWQAV